MAGTWGGANKWYAAVANDNTLITLDTLTGARTVIGKFGVTIYGLAYDYTSATLYGVAYDGISVSSLYKITR